MPLPVPNLDDRTFQEIVNEARKRIPTLCPEWTDHNLSDPGITLIELFSWMTEMMLYRMNKVTDKNYVKFLEMIGVRLNPAAPALVDVTMRLASPMPNAVTVPRGTEIATVRTETDDSIIFTTNEPLTITPAALGHFLITRDGQLYEDQLPLLLQWRTLAGLDGGEGRRFAVFADSPQPPNAFLIGFTSDIRHGVISVDMDFAERGAPGVVPSNPPLAWEYFDSVAGDWQPFLKSPDADAWLEQDGTRGFNTRGTLVLHVPSTAAEHDVMLTANEPLRAYWVRCRVIEGGPETGRYERSPRLGAIDVATLGGSASASHMATVIGEVLGISEGKPGQSFAVTRLPMLPLQPGETLEVEREDNTGWDPWQQVEDFSNSGPDDKHFVADPVSGEIMLGPVVRSVTGVERHFGAVPPAGMHLRLTRYRTGGGPEGNLGRNTLVALKSSIPYIDSVTNRRVASGGVDPESIGSAKIRGPQILRTRNRAVTEEDFEFLAREASPSVVRARCVQPTEVGTEGDPLPGVVRVLVVPTLPSGTDRTIMPDDIRPPTELLQQVREYLDERRLLTTVLTVSQPEYVWVSVEAVVKARNGTNHDRVREAVESRLYSFIHPIHGGTDGDGWPFGRNLFASELYSQLQPVSGVEYIQEIRVFPVDPVTGLRGDAVQTLEINRAGILCSYEHRVTIT